VVGLALARWRTLAGPASAAKISSVTNGIAKAKAKDSLRARRAAVRIRMTLIQIRMRPMPIRANLATGL
jgi:hypothetical protein